MLRTKEEIEQAIKNIEALAESVHQGFNNPVRSYPFRPDDALAIIQDLVVELATLRTNYDQSIITRNELIAENERLLQAITAKEHYEPPVSAKLLMEFDLRRLYRSIGLAIEQIEEQKRVKA